MFLAKLKQKFTEFCTMPRVRVDLMARAAADNDAFYVDLVRRHCADATRRHPRYPLIRKYVHGVALCELPESFDKYYYLIEASARRNHKKALREGCCVRRIRYNDHLEAIREIWQSTQLRQGKLMPAPYRNGTVRRCQNPPSRSATHDYAYFGAFLNGTLIGYCGCMIAGEYCGIQQILGHADYLTVGPVPLLIVSVAMELYAHHPQVKYYAYGTYFGATETMRRFKRKFAFLPHRVDWTLGEAPRPVTPAISESAPRKAA
jgi:hypothetical protein